MYLSDIRLAKISLDPLRPFIASIDLLRLDLGLFKPVGEPDPAWHFTEAGARTVKDKASPARKEVLNCEIERKVDSYQSCHV